MQQSWQEIRSLWRAAEERPRASRGAVTVLRRHFHEPRIVERMAAFENFIEQTSRRPFVWGQSDCSLMVADWCVWSGYEDPAAAWRGTYSDEAGCRALVAERGDLMAVVAACASVAGLKPIHEPEFGCVAVIGSAHRPERQWAAIWNGARWAVWFGNADRVQWEAMSAKALAMWRV
ncbi:DUF6950 family protein [Devosia sp. Naph2]|uniref:DUF6950 family protein n=1 Tax=Devosia polycyclovorans TaxID=3345148 RepID=UPI0035CED51C